jgi:hypothetical protein
MVYQNNLNQVSLENVYLTLFFKRDNFLSHDKKYSEASHLYLLLL